jgi:hypothetical protein
MSVSILELFNCCNETFGLPYLTDMLLMQLRVYGDFSRHNSHRRASIPTEVGKALRESQSILNKIMNDACNCWSIRCSSAMLLMFVADSNTVPVAEISQLFVENCNSLNGKWMLEGLVTTLTISDHKQTPALTALMRDLFDACREDYCTRGSLEQVQMFWREKSTAPVTTASVRDKLLYRSDA